MLRRRGIIMIVVTVDDGERGNGRGKQKLIGVNGKGRVTKRIRNVQSLGSR